ncbi:MAG TPA: response regulator transcription factor [Candidatus Acidoferrales bacterium]|jgi:DNA-binding NarL/FixJ family response regulator|nr:response regulator transcription factor [Candidatus Acidoferrales bacterium]
MAGRLLSDQFRRVAEFDVVSCTADRSSLVDTVKEAAPSIVLVSADLQDGPLSGLAALRDVQETNLGVRSILLSDRPDQNIVVEGLRAGARGFFSRCNFDFDALCKCVRRVCEGQIWIGNTELQYVFDALVRARPLRVMNSDGLNLLSKREEEVMRLVAEGLGNREVADLLKLSEHTVKNYLFHIFDKLGISNRVELVLYAVSHPRAEPMPRGSRSAVPTARPAPARNKMGASLKRAKPDPDLSDSVPDCAKKGTTAVL